MAKTYKWYVDQVQRFQRSNNIEGALRVLESALESEKSSIVTRLLTEELSKGGSKIIAHLRDKDTAQEKYPLLSKAVYMAIFKEDFNTAPLRLFEHTYNEDIYDEVAPNLER